jgi:general secretion pathway protein I
MRHRPARGFTLLEAIAALAILAAAGMAVFAAMSQSLQMVARADQARELDTALRNALAWSGRINPMTEPDGEAPLGDWTLRWHSEPVEPPRDGATPSFQPGLYKVGLYRMRLELWRDGAMQREATVRRAGYQQVRELAVP